MVHSISTACHLCSSQIHSATRERHKVECGEREVKVCKLRRKAAKTLPVENVFISIWYTLQMERKQVPRETVRVLLKEIDPEKPKAFVEGLIIHQDLILFGMWMVMTSLNHMASQYRVVLMVIVGKSYG